MLRKSRTVEKKLCWKLNGDLHKSFIIKYKQPLYFRGEFIVPSFAEVWPELGRKKEDEGMGKKKPMAKMSMDYILEVS